MRDRSHWRNPRWRAERIAMAEWIALENGSPLAESVQHASPVTGYYYLWRTLCRRGRRKSVLALTWS